MADKSNLTEKQRGIIILILRIIKQIQKELQDLLDGK